MTITVAATHPGLITTALLDRLLKCAPHPKEIRVHPSLRWASDFHYPVTYNATPVVYTPTVPEDTLYIISA